MDAVLEDIIHALNEYVEWLAFVDNTGKTTGKGSTLLKRRLKECKDLRAYAQSIIDALQQGNLFPDMVKHRDPAKYFIANCAAKHRVPRTYPLNNPTQEDVPKDIQKGPGRGKSSTRGGHSSVRGRGGKGSGFISATSLATNDDEEIGNDAATVCDDILVGIQDVEEATGEQLLLHNDITSAPTQGNTTSRSGRGRRGGHVIRCGRGSAGGHGSRNGPQGETSAVRDAARGRQRCRGAMQTTYEPRRNPERERRGYNPHYRGDDYSTDEECHPFDDLAPTAEQEKTKIAGNPPTYCFLPRPKANKGRWCEGCGRKFQDSFYQSPMNLVFRFKCIVHWFDPGGIRRQSRDIQNAYFHAADLGCLKNLPELELLNHKDLYIEQACYAQLTDDQKDLLRKRRHWVPVRQNRARVIQQRN